MNQASWNTTVEDERLLKKLKCSSVLKFQFKFERDYWRQRFKATRFEISPLDDVPVSPWTKLQLLLLEMSEVTGFRRMSD